MTFSTAILVRSGLISAIYARSLRLTNRARSVLPNGRLVTLISSDVTRVQNLVETGVLALSGPVQIFACLVLLWAMMGPTAMSGFVVILTAVPPLFWVMDALKNMRNRSVRWTSRRVELVQEVLSNMKIVKFFAWEVRFGIVRIIPY